LIYLFDGGEHQWVWRQWLVNNPVSNELGNILDKLIEFGTKKRYQSASEVLQALQIKTSVSIPQTTIQKPVNPVISVPQTPPSIQLKSAKGIDYRNLEDLLKRQQWKQADKETARVMLQVANRTKERWLREEDIDNFPCEDLRTIDQLWLKYSNGKFGFSVQAKIYRELGGTRQYNERVWDAFGDRVGWRVNNSWIQMLANLENNSWMNQINLENNSWICYKDVTFDLKAPLGHLPVMNGLDSVWRRWGVFVSSLASRLVKCNI
jgi:hypothetical protein